MFGFVSIMGWDWGSQCFGIGLEVRLVPSNKAKLLKILVLFKMLNYFQPNTFP